MFFVILAFQPNHISLLSISSQWILSTYQVTVHSW